MRVLIVEDSETSALLIRTILDNAGYDTVIACDGVEALEVLESGPSVDLVLADVQMPRLDGLGLMRRMQDNPDWAGTPVLICSGMDTLDVVKEASRLGSKGYIAKPIDDVGRVIAKVEEVLDTDPPILADPIAARMRASLDVEEHRQSLADLAILVRERIELLESIDRGRWNAGAFNLAALIDVGSKAGARRLVRFLSHADRWEGGTGEFYERFTGELHDLLPLLADEIPTPDV